MQVHKNAGLSLFRATIALKHPPSSQAKDDAVSEEKKAAEESSGLGKAEGEAEDSAAKPPTAKATQKEDTTAISKQGLRSYETAEEGREMAQETIRST